VIVLQITITVAVRLHLFLTENSYFTLFQQPVEPVIDGQLDNGLLDNPEQFQNNKKENFEQDYV